MCHVQSSPTHNNETHRSVKPETNSHCYGIMLKHRGLRFGIIYRNKPIIELTASNFTECIWACDLERRAGQRLSFCMSGDYTTFQNLPLLWTRESHENNSQKLFYKLFYLIILIRFSRWSLIIPKFYSFTPFLYCTNFMFYSSTKLFSFFLSFANLLYLAKAFN